MKALLKTIDKLILKRTIFVEGEPQHDYVVVVIICKHGGLIMEIGSPEDSLGFGNSIANSFSFCGIHQFQFLHFSLI